MAYHNITIHNTVALFNQGPDFPHQRFTMKRTIINLHNNLPTKYKQATSILGQSHVNAYRMRNGNTSASITPESGPHPMLKDAMNPQSPSAASTKLGLLRENAQTSIPSAMETPKEEDTNNFTRPMRSIVKSAMATKSACIESNTEEKQRAFTQQRHKGLNSDTLFCDTLITMTQENL